MFNFINKKIKNNTNLGFTIVETLVAISILSISILATFSAVQAGLQYSGNAKNQTIAFFLIQEAMEYVKNIRDQNALNYLGGTSTNWLSGVSSPGDPCDSKVCQLDLNSSGSMLTSCPTTFDSCTVLNNNTVTGQFGFNGAWTPTTYNRGIQITNLGSDEALITVHVGWVYRGQSRFVEVSQLIYNRQ